VVVGHKAVPDDCIAEVAIVIPFLVTAKAVASVGVIAPLTLSLTKRQKCGETATHGGGVGDVNWEIVVGECAHIEVLCHIIGVLKTEIEGRYEEVGGKCDCEVVHQTRSRIRW
jgi:hypothetical protein